MNGVLFLQVVLVDKLHSLTVLLRQPALSDGLLLQFHQIYGVNGLPVPADHIVEVLACGRVQKIISPDYYSR